jgi:hypothetical protein
MMRRLTILTLALLPLACGGSDDAPEPVIRPVRYVEVFQSGGVRVRRFSGVARASVEAPLSRVRG